MITRAGLQGELMIKLCELADIEQNEMKIAIALYIGQYERCRAEKLADFQKSIEQQILFYGKIKDEQTIRIQELVQKYNQLIEKVIIEYNTRFIAIMNEINDTQANHKISMTNMKLSMEFNNEVKKEATKAKKSNYEIVLQECFRQLSDCPVELMEKLNQVFYAKSNQLIVRKQTVFEKIKKILYTKSKIEKKVFKKTEIELANLEKKIAEELGNINHDTIQNIAIIKDAQIQTQDVFNRMLEG